MKSLVFDTTSAQTILDSDNVGAFLRASDGTLLTHTDIGGKKALDVNIAEGVNVEVDLSHVDDSVALGDGTNLFTSTTVNTDIGLDVFLINEELDVNITNASIVVTATDLDIRDLSFASDSVDVSGSEVSISGDVNVTQGTSPWIVSATDLDIRDLDAAQDSVQSNLFDGAGTALTSTLEGGKQALDVFVANEIQVNDSALANSAIANAAKTLAVANTAEVAVSSNLADRKYLFVHNFSNQEMYVGSSGVSAANGFPIPPKGILEMRLGAAADLYFIGRTGATPEIRTLELA